MLAAVWQLTGKTGSGRVSAVLVDMEIKINPSKLTETVEKDLAKALHQTNILGFPALSSSHISVKAVNV